MYYSYKSIYVHQLLHYVLEYMYGHCFDHSLQDYKVKNAGPFLEICKDDAIQFVVILDNNEGFYVPEISKDSEVYKDDTKKIN